MPKGVKQAELRSLDWRQESGGPKAPGGSDVLDASKAMGTTKQRVKTMFKQLDKFLKKHGNEMSLLMRQWDENRDGRITKGEFKKALKYLGYEAGKGELDGLFDILDQDGSGYIDYAELVKMSRGDDDGPALVPSADSSPTGEVRRDGLTKFKGSQSLPKLPQKGGMSATNLDEHNRMQPQQKGLAHSISLTSDGLLFGRMPPGMVSEAVLDDGSSPKVYAHKKRPKQRIILPPPAMRTMPLGISRVSLGDAAQTPSPHVMNKGRTPLPSIVQEETMEPYRPPESTLRLPLRLGQTKADKQAAEREWYLEWLRYTKGGTVRPSSRVRF